MFFFGHLLWPFWGGFEESYAHLEEVRRLITILKESTVTYGYGTLLAATAWYRSVTDEKAVCSRKVTRTLAVGGPLGNVLFFKFTD
jgi:hypothetical protein